MDVPTLKRAMEQKFDDEIDMAKDDIRMKADHIFGHGHPCETQERSNEWISSLIESIVLFVLLSLAL